MPLDALQRLPHQEPFRFVSELTLVEPARRAVGVWRISGNEDFFRGHFPGEPIVPGVLLAEALAQLSGIVCGEEAGDRRSAVDGPSRLAQVSVKFHHAVTPPADVLLESSLTREMGGLWLFDVRAEVRGEPAASGTLVLARRPEIDRKATQ